MTKLQIQKFLTLTSTIYVGYLFIKSQIHLTENPCVKYQSKIGVTFKCYFDLNTHTLQLSVDLICTQSKQWLTWLKRSILQGQTILYLDQLLCNIRAVYKPKIYSLVYSLLVQSIKTRVTAPFSSFPPGQLFDWSVHSRHITTNQL